MIFVKEMDSKMLYYIRSLEHEHPKGVACWWGKNRCGYTNDLFSAGLYTEPEAKEICDAANITGVINEQMIPQDLAEEAATRTVDTSKLPSLQVFNSKLKDVHTEHCCSKHGCKYGENDTCPVATGTKKQSYPCQDCRGAVLDT